MTVTQNSLSADELSTRAQALFDQAEQAQEEAAEARKREAPYQIGDVIEFRPSVDGVWTRGRVKGLKLGWALHRTGRRDVCYIVQEVYDDGSLRDTDYVVGDTLRPVPVGNRVPVFLEFDVTDDFTGDPEAMVKITAGPGWRVVASDGTILISSEG